MAIAFSIADVVLGLLFMITGSFKFFQSRDKVIASGGAWAADFAPGVIKAISGLELISGLLVLIGKLSVHWRNLSFTGAACIGLIMAGSIYTHIRRKEFKHAIINSVFLLIALFVAYGAKS